MNKSILLSVKPEQAVKILNGNQTLLLQKRVPKDFVGWVYIYVTKARPLLQKKGNVFIERESYARAERIQNIVNGKAVARFWFDKKTLYTYEEYLGGYLDENKEIMLQEDIEELKKICLSYAEIINYGLYKGASYVYSEKLYAWHIKNLEIFDEPKELHEFVSPYDPVTFVFGLRKPPSNWRYVYKEE